MSDVSPAITTAPLTITPPPSTLTVLPWLDPVVDDVGFPVRDRYVERFWLGILGPTATWLMRRLDADLDQHPDGYEMNLDHTARALGVAHVDGRASPFQRAIQRCIIFGLASQHGNRLAVRRKLPPLTQRQLARLPDDLQAEHKGWFSAPASS